MSTKTQLIIPREKFKDHLEERIQIGEEMLNSEIKTFEESKKLNNKLSNLIKLSLAIGKIPVIEFMEPEVYVKREIQKREDQLPLKQSD